jgi:hypothetical protein
VIAPPSLDKAAIQLLVSPPQTDVMSEETAEKVREEPKAIPLTEFLESVPPGSVTPVSEFVKPRLYQGGGGIAGYPFLTPDIQLHCGSDSCNRTLFFRRTSDSPPELPTGKWQFFYVTYTCSNCRKTEKTFSLAARQVDGKGGQIYKFGELPEYGPPTAARLIKLIGPDREIFLKGRRCENQGLGIGAFVYYRRVVENQKNRILDEIIKVAKKLGASAEAIAELEAAKAETQFSKALASVRTSIPQMLLVNGHNPLTLLHSALSDGLHQRSDEECLELASSIRIVLAELSERLAQALKDEAELNRALSRLMEPRKASS